MLEEQGILEGLMGTALRRNDPTSGLASFDFFSQISQNVSLFGIFGKFTDRLARHGGQRRKREGPDRDRARRADQLAGGHGVPAKDTIE